MEVCSEYSNKDDCVDIIGAGASLGDMLSLEGSLVTSAFFMNLSNSLFLVFFTRGGGSQLHSILKDHMFAGQPAYLNEVCEIKQF